MRFSKIRSAILSIRYTEVLVFQGAPLLGVAFAGGLHFQHLPSVSLFVVADCCLFAHIFALNDWANLDEDSSDPRKADSTFAQKGLSSREMLYLVIALGAVTMFLFSAFSLTTFLLGVGMLILSLLYSHPMIAHKRWPFMSSLNHFTGGVIQFLLGYSAFAVIDTRSVLIGLYFAIVLVAGHIIQEVRDYDGDRASGIPTKAVQFGKRRMFLTAFCLFALSYCYLGLLAASKIFPPYSAFLILPMFLHLVFFYRTWRTSLTFANIEQYQVRYRLLYGMIGLAMLVLLSPSGTAGPW